MASPAQRDYGRLFDVAAATIAGMARDEVWPAISAAGRGFPRIP
jgi:hypothetical protein